MHVQNSREVPEYEIDPTELDFSNSVNITKVISEPYSVCQLLNPPPPPPPHFLSICLMPQKQKKKIVKDDDDEHCCNTIMNCCNSFTIRLSRIQHLVSLDTNIDQDQVWPSH